MDFRFSWDGNKEKVNLVEHGVTFREAATVFNDPRQVSLFDESHSQTEDRWITFGISANGRLLAVCHTFLESDADTWIRIISSRKATKREQRQYEANA